MKKTQIFPVLLFFAVTYYWGCSGNNPADPEINSIPQTSLSRLSELQAQVFTQNCTSSGCHGTVNNQANLLLTAGNSFSNLVNVQSVLFPQFKRVEPGNSSQSLLIKILKGEVSPRMPLNRNPLPADLIDTISSWIDKGAPND